jgi:site-specific recombinase XerD
LEEISALVQAASELRQENEAEFGAVRNAFIVELLLATGLRADEIRLLAMSQIADDVRWLKNVRTKGKRFRNVYMDTEVRNIVSAYLERREAELVSRFPEYEETDRETRRKFPVLVSFYKARLSDPKSFGVSPKTIWNAVSSVGSKAQARFPERLGKLHPHRLRHAFAHGLLDSSKDIRLVAQALGHSDVRTTMRYTERTEEEIAHAIEQRIAARPAEE